MDGRARQPDGAGRPTRRGPAAARARISALVRSSAVRPGARSAHSPPMDRLLMSPMDMSMPPVTSHRPASITSAPTDSRARIERGAGADGPAVDAARRGVGAGFDGRVADHEPPGHPGADHVDAAADDRPAPGRVLDQEHAALDRRVLGVHGGPGRGLDLRAGQVQRAVYPGAQQPDLADRGELVDQPDGAAHPEPVRLDRAVAQAVHGGVDAAAGGRRSPTRTARSPRVSRCSRWSSARRPPASGTGRGRGAAAGRCRAGRAAAGTRSATARTAAAPSTTGAESNSHPSKRSGNGTRSPARSRRPDTTASASRSPRGSIWRRSSWQHLRSSSAGTVRLTPLTVPATTAPVWPARISSPSSISFMTRPQADALPRTGRAGPVAATLPAIAAVVPFRTPGETGAAGWCGWPAGAAQSAAGQVCTGSLTCMWSV